LDWASERSVRYRAALEATRVGQISPRPINESGSRVVLDRFRALFKEEGNGAETAASRKPLGCTELSLVARELKFAGARTLRLWKLQISASRRTVSGNLCTMRMSNAA
jgi:hypothetical protein